MNASRATFRRRSWCPQQSSPGPPPRLRQRRSRLVVSRRGPGGGPAVRSRARPRPAVSGRIDSRHAVARRRPPSASAGWRRPGHLPWASSIPESMASCRAATARSAPAASTVLTEGFLHQGGVADAARRRRERGHPMRHEPSQRDRSVRPDCVVRHVEEMTQFRTRSSGRQPILPPKAEHSPEVSACTSEPDRCGYAPDSRFVGLPRNTVQKYPRIAILGTSHTAGCGALIDSSFRRLQAG